MSTASSAPGLRIDEVSFSYGGHPVLRSVSLAVPQGELVALAGPNGSGKTTLLRVLTGLARPASGAVSLHGAPLSSYRSREVARRIAVVAQHVDPYLAFTVEELVAMGRTPHIRLFSAPSAIDRAAVHRALHDTDTLRLANRHFNELSGGEQQRVMVAVGLAQETDYLLLDEPTVHLDLHHQHELLELLVRLNRDRKIAVVAVLHDLNLAALYFQRLILLSQGEIVADGGPSEVLTEPTVHQVFHAPMRLVRHPTSGRPQVLLDPPPGGQ